MKKNIAKPFSCVIVFENKPTTEGNKMAYVQKELKVKVVGLLKEIMPKGWRYSLAIKHHTALVLTIQNAPVDLTADRFCDLNEKQIRNTAPAGHADLFVSIFKAMNCENYNNSDIMTDYYSVGYYTEINIGTYEKPFKVK